MIDRAIAADKAYENGTNRSLEGIPIGLKDNIDSNDSPTTGGSPALKGHIPRFNCTLWDRLLVQGAYCGGKTNMHEMSYGTMSNNPFYGPVVSSFDKERSAGGSSGGSAGAVSIGALPLALGTDTGGSIRIPASWNGVVGFKPSIHRWPADFGIKMTHHRDTIGPLAVSMEDVSLIDEIVTGERPLDIPKPESIRIGVPNEYFYEDLDPLVA